jgi:signal transduction histidine kinase
MNRFENLSLIQRFNIVSLFILLIGMALTGWWVKGQIAEGVVRRTAANTALYVDSFIAARLQELATQDSLSKETVSYLDNLLADTALGQEVSIFKVWDLNGHVVYSSDPAMIGQTFPVTEGLAYAASGQVSGRMGQIDLEENPLAQGGNLRFLEVYSPIRRSGTNQIIAVVEFYQKVDALQSEINWQQLETATGVALAGISMYLLLVISFWRASNTIQRQQTELRDRIFQLTQVVAQNKELHERIRRAAARTADINERYLRRVSAELHDGPIQDLSFALLRVDNCIARSDQSPTAIPELEVMRASLQGAMKEIRAISSGLGLPHLNQLTLKETVHRAVREHVRRTGTHVDLNASALNCDAPMPVKIALYRVLQEALNNSFRHAEGRGQRVNVGVDGEMVQIEVVDNGPGFESDLKGSWDHHLGLAGMRERVESLGGLFQVVSQKGRGTQVVAHLPLQLDGQGE